MDKVDNFPIKVPYTTNPGMERYWDRPFNINPDPGVIQQKHIELERWKTELYGETDKCRTNDLIKIAAETCCVRPSSNIVDFAIQFEEDVAIIHRGILSAICFCFPSSWRPSQRLGIPLSQIHQAVADGQLLVRASNRIAETMAANGSFRRYVWTISNSGDLNQHPQNKSTAIPQSLNDLYFRTETQTTVPLGDGVSSLFFVRVKTCPLLDVWDRLGQTIIESVDSMTDTVLDYKNLREVKKIINLYRHV